MQLLISFEFYIKNICLLVFSYIYIYIYFFILIKSNKHANTTYPFNKWIVLGLRNLDLFNKHVRLVLTHIVGYSWVNTTQTWHVNTNCHYYFQIPYLIPVGFFLYTVWLDNGYIIYMTTNCYIYDNQLFIVAKINSNWDNADFLLGRFLHSNLRAPFFRWTISPLIFIWNLGSSYDIGRYLF